MGSERMSTEETGLTAQLPIRIFKILQVYHSLHKDFMLFFLNP